MPEKNRTHLFQWGYEGWGNATEKLVGRVDAVERDRGHEPPIFVDIRFSRSVRAVGFRDKAFGQLLGDGRYHWMKTLGNAAIGSEGDEIRIHTPAASEQLLDLAIDAARAAKRVIFFCSCASPNDAGYCHRSEVAKLLLQSARKRSVSIEVEEWPGGAPKGVVEHRVEITEGELRRVRKGAKSVAITPAQATSALAAMAWGSMVELATHGDRQVISAGPPSCRAGNWHLPIFLFPVEEEDSAESLKPVVDREVCASRSRVAAA